MFFNNVDIADVTNRLVGLQGKESTDSKNTVYCYLM